MDKVLDFIRDNPMAAVVAAGEIGFWVFIAAGLVARYLLRLRRTSVVLLAMTPVVDVVVLVATMIDLSGGGQATWTHGLAAVYLGFSVVFGPSMIRWADVRFAHRFAGGPPPVKRGGEERLRHEWREWGKCVLACAIAAVVLAVLVLVVGTPARTTALWSGGGAWLPRLGWITGIWLVLGPLWQLVSVSGSREGARR
ncbi:hypothetical protein [Amycolatopsis sp. YIM 10]|uniref:hypothetical protein n=1 Tax=Amycolatopsis sp. YIM 10 TaxID=2653857 RepID=UPI00129014FE|nr:hypothetical protein [Amycolatopsis sp. YIM 10]QFU88128.1 hypothetical protein YIM_14710 [Amycolatopsis sp. YIM 10]